MQRHPIAPPGGCDFARHIQHLVAVGLVPQPGDDGVVEVVSIRTTVYLHVYGAVASVVLRPRDGTDRKSRPVLLAGDTTKNVRSGLQDTYCVGTTGVLALVLCPISIVGCIKLLNYLAYLSFARFRLCLLRTSSVHTLDRSLLRIVGKLNSPQ